MWEVMSFGERPYWDMSNHEVHFFLSLFLKLLIFLCVEINFLFYLVTGDEIHQRGLQVTGAHGLSVRRQPAHAAVLDAGPLQTTTLR